MTEQKDKEPTAIRKILFILILPIFFIPVLVFILVDYILDGASFKEGWRRYIR